MEPFQDLSSDVSPPLCPRDGSRLWGTQVSAAAVRRRRCWPQSISAHLAPYSHASASPAALLWFWMPDSQFCKQLHPLTRTTRLPQLSQHLWDLLESQDLSLIYPESHSLGHVQTLLR